MKDTKEYADNYAKLPFEDKMVEIRRQEVIASILKYPHQKILEIGCGASPLFMHFDDYQEMHVVEPVDAFYDNACYLAANKKYVLLYHDYTDRFVAELRGANLDFVVLSSVLPDVKEPLALLETLGEICTPDTILHINVPNAYSVHRILAKEMGLITDVFEFSQANKDMQQYVVYSMDSLKECLAQSCFSVIEEGSYFIKPFTHQQMALGLAHGIITDEMLAGLSRLEPHMPGLGAEIFVNCRKTR
ncbi:MAG: class I SAM-dependent methyltransferase [Lachnospiraceae bacterium]|jgi:2-polyprenyl-3-methyl-5-hydroxy-6-metoxy-1,4-benzoquinol methylase|nr:class I SAM-dependent methyltransferase [Lachnospiraceae bacterium]